MAEARDKYGIIFRNLTDAGCDKKTAEIYTDMILNGKSEQVLHFLEKYRLDLLDKLHINQKRIDCLDFLVYRIRKEINHE